jgi:hypothetical protein
VSAAQEHFCRGALPIAVAGDHRPAVATVLYASSRRHQVPFAFPLVGVGGDGEPACNPDSVSLGSSTCGDAVCTHDDLLEHV